jgi:hypothetical protein
MTAFISHYWKRARLQLAVLEFVLLWVSACLCMGMPDVARAESTGAEVSQLQIERTAEGIFLSASVRFDLPTAVEDALLKGVPLFFVAEVDVYRDRWYWYDKRLLSAERHLRLAYQPLTRRWRLNVASGAITANSLGVALNQSFESLPEALAALRRVSRWKIADTAEIDPEQRHSVVYNFRLDLAQLPRPFQIGVLGQAEWNISASTTQRLSMETAK